MTLAARNKRDLLSLTPQILTVAGNFTLADDSDPTDLVGDGYEVSRTDSGVFLLELEDKSNEIFGAEFSLQNTSAPVDLDLIWKQVDTLSGVLSTVQAGTAIDCNSDHVVHFCIYAHNSDVDY